MKSFDLGAFGALHYENPSQGTGPVEMLLPSADEMRSIDQEEIARCSSLELMERAGCVCCEEILRYAQQLAHVVVLCGPGNNGGDGLVIVRLLREKGVRATAVATMHAKYSPEFITQSAKLPELLWYGKNTDAQAREVLSVQQLQQVLADASLIVDALLGTGQSEAPRGALAEVLALLGELRLARKAPPIVSIDLPTGCNASNGALYEPHVIADATIAIQCIKRGLLQFPARAACGEITVRDIGIRTDLGAQFRALLGFERFRLPPRSPDTHKGRCGHVVVVAGSEEMAGASVLAATSAIRAGAGVVTRCSKSGWGASISVPSEIMVSLSGRQSPTFEAADTEQILQVIDRASVVVLGPGMGESAESLEVAGRVLKECANKGTPVVVDASALFALPLVDKSMQKTRGESFIATPHPGEAARLLGCTSDQVQSDRFRAVIELQTKFGGTWVLKGAGTLVWNGSEGVLVPRGTPYLATAGSGDVLAGLIGALRCAAPPFESSALAVLIHAVAGERAAAATQGPITASDLFGFIPALVGAATDASSFSS